MLFSIISCYFLSLYCYVICKDDYSSEYKNLKEMYDKEQQGSDSKTCFGFCKHGKHETFSNNSKELTINEYSDSSEGGKTLDNENYDKHLGKIREKASQKYAHPDDQELYLAARTYTPTIRSSEISSLIHSVNSRYKHILSSNNSCTTKSVRTTKKRTEPIKTKRPRFTIFRAKHISPTFDYNKVESIATDNTDVIERHSVSCEDVHETKSKQQNNQDEEENNLSLKSAVDPESFKSFLMAQATKRNNPLNKFIDSIDEQNLYRPEPSVTTEDAVFNSSYYRYIENQIDEFEERHRRHYLFGKGFNTPERVTVFDKKKEAFYQDNLVNKQVFKDSAELLGGHYVDKLHVAPDKDQHVQYTEKLHDYNKENVQIGQQTEFIFDHPETKTEPDYKSEYYENPEGVIQSKEVTAFDKSQFYRFAKDAQNKEDAGDAAYDKSEFYRLGDVQNKEIPLRIVHIEDKEKRDPNKTSKISRNSKGLNKTKANKTLISAKKGCPSCSNKTFHFHYQQRGYRKQPRQRYHHHHHHHKRHHHYRRRGPYNPYMPRDPYMPPSPFLYNEYCPPPFPYPPQYYQQPQQHPHFYHFTTPHPNNHIPPNKIGVPASHHVPESSVHQTTLGETDDQYSLYLKLKDIFKPVENVLQGVSISSLPLSSIKMSTTVKSTTRTTRRITQSTTRKRYRYTIPPLPMAGGTMNPDDMQKYLEKHFNLPPPPPVNSSTDNPFRIRIEDYLPKDIFQDQRYFYTGCTRSILDHHPDYPEATTSPRKHTRTQRHYRTHRGRRNRQRHQHCCCHHHHRRRPRRPSKKYPRRRYLSGGIVEERYIDSKDIPPEDNEEGVTGLKSFEYTSFETLYRGLKYNSEKPEDHTKPPPKTK